MSDAKTNEFEDEECSYGKCENTPTHSLYHGEYHYCDKHYVIIGECDYCRTPIHESWDCSPTMCRPCGKDRSECEKCDEVFLSEEGDHNYDGLFCCPSCLSEKCASENPERPCFNDLEPGPDGKPYCPRHRPCECGTCDVIGGSCEKAMHCANGDHTSSKTYVMDEMWRCGDVFYCCRECCPTTKRRKRIHPPKIAA